MTIRIDLPFRRSRLRWVIGLAVAAAVLTGWPGASSRRADTVPLPRPPITAQNFTGTWIDA